jgi:prevent-host-death family protein
MHSPSARDGSGVKAPSVPLAEAKNQLSALVARVEQGEEIVITRRGLPVARLVPDPQHQDTDAQRAQVVSDALKRLQALRETLVLEGDLGTIARDGLD